MSQVKFMKWHGAGNDFVVIDSRQHDAIVTKNLAAQLGDRHRGVGFDQLAEIRDGDEADIKLDFWNSDGSRAGACGNATRCVARYLMDQGGKNAVTIQTERGILSAVKEGDDVWVNMGHPQRAWPEIPLSKAVDPVNLPIKGNPVAVGMGNPHCVFFVDDVNQIDLEKTGSAYERHPLFPESTNVEFAQIIDRDEIRMRVWERGAGVTLACGSGACATVVAAVERGLTDRHVRMELDGGWLTIDMRDSGVWMTGPTAFVYEATLSDEFMSDVK